jgi:4-diphosphocytidyl-2-C-methyl-D-erythritol kinase
VSTADVYKRFNVEQVEHARTSKVIEAINNHDFRGICDNLHNVLETVTLDLYPEVRHIKEQMKRFGADGVLMSGSGPTVFGLVERESRLHRVYNGLRGFCSDVHAVRLIRSNGTC